MTLRGTIQNGQVLLDHPVELPDGTRVTLLRDEVYPHPLAPYDREKEIALLRESVARMDAGELGQDADEVFDELEKEIDSYLPSEFNLGS